MTTHQANKSSFHHLKGKIKRLLGAATADRQVEAEGAAEEYAGDVPTEGQVQRERRAVNEEKDTAS